jgi:hypothetical protein
MGLHVNIVIAPATTVGGNERGIRIRRTEVGTDLHLLGCGGLDCTYDGISPGRRA